MAIKTYFPISKNDYVWLGEFIPNPSYGKILGDSLFDNYSNYLFLPKSLSLSTPEFKDAFIPEVNGDLSVKRWNLAPNPNYTVDQSKINLVTVQWQPA